MRDLPKLLPVLKTFDSPTSLKRILIADDSENKFNDYFQIDIKSNDNKLTTNYL